MAYANHKTVHLMNILQFCIILTNLELENGDPLNSTPIDTQKYKTNMLYRYLQDSQEARQSLQHRYILYTVQISTGLIGGQAESTAQVHIIYCTDIYRTNRRPGRVYNTGTYYIMYIYP